MQYVRDRVLKREFFAGTWCSLASPMASEIIGLAGYDWALLDQEHSPSTGFSLLGQLQSLAASATAPIVRVPWLDRMFVKSALDLGASGIMFPSIDTAEQAAEATRHLRYAPRGIRGVSGGARCSGYGYAFQEYYAEAGDNLLGVMQIETGAAVENCERMAAVDGADVLFVGPMDLGTNVNLPGRFKDDTFMALLARVSEAARQNGKAAGILLPDTSLVPVLKGMGYTFIAVGSDSAILAGAFKANLESIRKDR